MAIFDVALIRSLLFLPGVRAPTGESPPHVSYPAGQVSNPAPVPPPCHADAGSALHGRVAIGVARSHAPAHPCRVPRPFGERRMRIPAPRGPLSAAVAD